MTGTRKVNTSSTGATQRPATASADVTSGGATLMVPTGPHHCRSSSTMMLPPNTVATMAASSPNRVSNTNSPCGPASVRTPIISENSTSATSALIRAFLKMKAAPGAREVSLEAVVAFTRGPSDFFDFGQAEQAGRKEDQHYDQDRERRDVLVLDREIGRPERLDQSDCKPAQHRAGQRTDAAEHRRRECLDAGHKTHEEIDQAIIEQVHHAGDGGERRPDHEGHGNGAVDIDAEQRGHGLVLLAGAHVAAKPCARDQPGEQRQQHHGG